MKMVIGIVLLAGALVLSYVTSSNGEAMLAKKDTMVSKYVEESKNALMMGDTSTAIKNAKMAIQADPMNKKGFTAYDEALKTKYQPTGGNETTMDMPMDMPMDIPMPAEEEEDMGC